MIRNLFGGSSKCRTIDKVDIFGDGSGVALYRLDGNANDTGGNYHGTETAITYGGGTYSRGAINNTGNIDFGTGSKALLPATTSYSISMWVKRNDAVRVYLPNRINAYSSYGDNFYWESDNKLYACFATGVTTQVVAVSTNTYTSSTKFAHIVFSVNRTTQQLKVYFNGAEIAFGALTVPTSSYDNSLNTRIFARHDASSSPTGQMDQLRFFNRAITETEVATLYAECAPTSIVDNANPFEDNSLRAMYQFNGNANDLTGLYNGTASSMVYTSGKFGQCADFTTSAPSCSFPNSIFSGLTSVSFSAWIYMTNVISDSTPISSNAVSGNYFITPIRIYNGYAFGQFGLGGTSAVLTPQTSLPITANTWTHVYFVFNSDRTLQMSVNGSALTEKSTASSYLLSSVVSPIYLFHNGGYDYSTGKIDQLRIFNRALTPMEVASLYTETTPLEEPLAALVDPFKDGSGKALYRLEGNALDESGNYNGTATSVTYENGVSGRCGVFNGSSSYISSAATLGVSSFSYSLWVNPSTISTTAKHMIDFVTNRCALTNGNGTTSAVSYYDGSYKAFAYTLTASVNTHLVLVVSGTSATLYANGVSQGTITVTSLSPSGGVRLGSNSTNNGAWFAGNQDQVRFFSRALTADEVLKLYNNLA